jgi:hypothetical protein
VNVNQFEPWVLALLTKLEEIRLTQIERPRTNRDVDEVIIYAVTVTVAGEPVQGPDIPVPPGYSTTVRQRIHAGSPTGYAALSRSNVLSSVRRTHLQDGASVDLNVPNFASLWFDADAANVTFELIAEL